MTAHRSTIFSDTVMEAGNNAQNKKRKLSVNREVIYLFLYMVETQIHFGRHALKF